MRKDETETKSTDPSKGKVERVGKDYTAEKVMDSLPDFEHVGDGSPASPHDVRFVSRW